MQEHLSSQELNNIPISNVPKDNFNNDYVKPFESLLIVNPLVQKVIRRTFDKLELEFIEDRLPQYSVSKNIGMIKEVLHMNDLKQDSGEWVEAYKKDRTGHEWKESVEMV